MSNVMYRNNQGIREVEDGKTGDVLAVSPSGVPAWKKVDAGTIPFLTTKLNAPANIAGALDALISLMLDIAETVTALDGVSRTAIHEQGNEIEALASGLRSTQSVTNALAEKNDSHLAMRLSNTSNPALRIEYGQQILRLDLSQPGSFDDALARLGADNIQDAIVRAVLLNRALDRKIDSMLDSIRVSEQRTSDLQSSVTLLSQQVRQLAETVSQKLS